ncbi:unnamed protein product [Brassica oleracea var. botrytis]
MVKSGGTFDMHASCPLSIINSRFPASRIISWVRLGSGPASPGRVFPEPEGPVPAFCDRDEQFASGWHRTRKHDNWPPKL